MKKRYITAFIFSILILIIAHKLWLITLSYSLKKLDIYLFFLIFIISYYSNLKLIEYINSLKEKENQPISDILFVSIFFIMLFVPISYINPAEKSENENRTLTVYNPLIKENGGLNYKYGNDFDKWFNDRFNFREKLIELYENKYKINKYIITDKLFKGKDDWYFYRGEISSVYSYQNINLFSDFELETIANKLQLIDDYCKKNNKKFYFIIAPDKSKIYGEYYNDLVNKINPDEKSKSQQLISYLKKNTNVKVIYPYQTLKNNKEKGLLYYKADTHWNSLGAYYGYSDLMNMIQKDYPNISKFTFDKYDKQEYLGDLYSMHPNILKSLKPTVYNVPETSAMKHTCEDIKDHRDTQTCNNIYGKYNLIMFRDSFTSGMLPYLAESFKNSTFIWGYNVNTEGTMDADVVILEIVERSIYKLLNIQVGTYNAF